MASIRDVAKEAGVSVSTVSKALNQYPGLRQDTRDRVLAAAAKLQFVPNAAASALSSKTGGRLALLMNVGERGQGVDEVEMRYMYGALHQAKAMGLDVCTLFFSMLEGKSLKECIGYLQAQNIVGLAVYGLSKKHKKLLSLIESQAFKMVLVDAPRLGPGMSTVSIDHAQAQYDVAKHMLESNPCQSLLYISGPPEAYVSGQRLEGMERLAGEMGLRLLVRNGGFSERRAREWTLRHGRQKGAIACASDMMAIGAMRALLDMDIFRPVCGFDGISLMGYAGKGMYTVRQDFAAISAAAIEELWALVKGGRGRELRLPHSLVNISYEDVIV